MIVKAFHAKSSNCLCCILQIHLLNIFFPLLGEGRGEGEGFHPICRKKSINQLAGALAMLFGTIGENQLANTLV